MIREILSRLRRSTPSDGDSRRHPADGLPAVLGQQRVTEGERMTGDSRIRAYQSGGNLVLSDAESLDDAQVSGRFIIVEESPEVPTA